MAPNDSSSLPAADAAQNASLVERLRAGEDAAFEQLVREHTGHLLAVARRIARTEADAEDAVQDAFLAAFKSIGSFDGRAGLGTWLHRITVNAALMRLRRQKSRPETSIDALLPMFRDGMHADHPGGWPRVTPDAPHRIEQHEALWRAVDQLPDDFRTVLLLRDVEGLDSKAVAASLEISDSLVRQRLHRARLALVKLLQPTMEGDTND